MRLIDADELTSKLREWQEYEKARDDCNAIMVRRFINFAKGSATVDAVPVVRCRDCESRLPDGTCKQWRIGSDGELADVDNEDYCSYGERRDDA